MEGSKMKKTYETMEAYKVSFNANEQIAAAACMLWEMAGKYGNMVNNPQCEGDIQNGQVVAINGAVDANGNPWTWGAADTALRYA